MRCDFVSYDDEIHVTANVQVQKGLTWESMKWACFNPVNSIWHPLTVWSHMADCQLFGLNAWGHHLTSVLLHAVNTLLVFLFLRGLTGAVGRSAWVAALFGWHPLHVESVAWVSERKDVLSAFFGLLALLAYVRYVEGRKQKAESRNRKPTLQPHVSPVLRSNAAEGGRFTFHAFAFYLLSLFLFALGLMSKPMLVTWPFVMLLLDCWPLRRMQKAEGGRQNAEASDTQHATRNTDHTSRFTFHVSGTALLPLVIEKVPFFVLAALGSVVTFVAQKRGGSLAVGESFPLGGRFGNALISYCRYLGKLLWPSDLAVFYPRPGHWPLGLVLLAGGLIVGISVLVWVPRRRYPYLLMGWLWYCGTLVPVSQMFRPAPTRWQIDIPTCHHLGC